MFTNKSFKEKFLLLQGSRSNIEFAEFCGVSDGTVRNCQKGIVPGNRLLIKIAEANDADITWLIAEDKEKPSNRTTAKNIFNGGVKSTNHQAETITINNDLSKKDDKLTAEELVLIRLIRTKKNPTNICIEIIGFIAAKE